MKILFVLTSLVAISVANSNEDLWKKFKIVRERLQKKGDHKKTLLNGKVSFEQETAKPAGLNQVQIAINNIKRDISSSSITKLSSEEDDLPDWIDWSSVPSVYDQGKECDASFYFAAVGAVSANRFIAQLEVDSLSIQYLIDCSVGNNNGCHGGGVENTLEWISDHGVPLASSYPYVGREGKCRNVTGVMVGKREFGYGPIKGSEKELKKAIANIGPLAVTIDGRDLPSYTGGVLNSPNCSQTVTSENAQSGLIMGYDTTEDGQDYWKVQFSFGYNWGENGYARIARNVNMCGIATKAYYVVF